MKSTLHNLCSIASAARSQGEHAKAESNKLDMRTFSENKRSSKIEAPTKAQIGKQTSGGCSIKPPLERSSSKLVHIRAILLSNVHQLKCSSLKCTSRPPTSYPSLWPNKLGLYKSFADCCYCTIGHSQLLFLSIQLYNYCAYIFPALSLRSWCYPEPNYCESTPLYLPRMCVCECQEKGKDTV